METQRIRRVPGQAVVRVSRRPSQARTRRVTTGGVTLGSGVTLPITQEDVTGLPEALADRPTNAQLTAALEGLGVGEHDHDELYDPLGAADAVARVLSVSMIVNGDVSIAALTGHLASESFPAGLRYALGLQHVVAYTDGSGSASFGLAGTVTGGDPGIYLWDGTDLTLEAERAETAFERGDTVLLNRVVDGTTFADEWTSQPMVGSMISLDFGSGSLLTIATTVAPPAPAPVALEATPPTPTRRGELWWDEDSGKAFVSVLNAGDELVWVEWVVFGAVGPMGPGLITVDADDANDAYVLTLPAERRTHGSVVLKRPV